jgi:hypothetical protein
LVADAVVDGFEVYGWEELVEGIWGCFGAVAGEESSAV